MSKKFIAFAVVLLLFLFAVQYRIPKRFVWQETYLHTDRQPFGSYVFDSLMAGSMPKGYEVTRKTLWQLNQDSLANHSVIVSNPGRYYFDKHDAEQVVALASRGNKVLVFCHQDWLADTLNFSICYANGSFSFKQFVEDDCREQVQWNDEDETLSMPCQFVQYYIGFSDSAKVIPGLCSYDYESDYEIETDAGEDSTVHVEVRRYLAVSRSVGRGEVIVCTTPLLLTNYAMLNGETRRHTVRLLGLLKDRPVVRTEALLTPKASQQESPFYLLLERPPLRWALNLSLLTVLLFVIFTARRRQRVIPVVTPPQNHNMEFVRLIGTLYHQQANHQQLLRMKLTYAAEEIRRQTGSAPDETGLLDDVRKAVESPQGITEEAMRHYIDKLDTIIKNL